MGGDFYDLFETGERGWTIVIGDVCGKGPDAAAVTALARYTLRAAAMRDRLPSRSLRRSTRRCCASARIAASARWPTPTWSPCNGGARVGFAERRPPAAPAAARRTATWSRSGAPGTLLGVLPDPRFEDFSMSLGPGDALVFYTDGVIEGRGGNGPTDETSPGRRCSPTAPAWARTPSPPASRRRHWPDPDGRPRDDIAVLVLRVAG